MNMSRRQFGIQTGVPKRDQSYRERFVNIFTEFIVEAAKLVGDGLGREDVPGCEDFSIKIFLIDKNKYLISAFLRCKRCIFN